MSEAEAKDLLAQYAIAFTARLAVTRDEALVALGPLRAPVVVKLVSRVLHKSDVGGVRLNISDEAALCQAIDAIDQAAADHEITVEGYLIEEMAAAGIEVIVGGIIDAVFGPAVMVGLGGIFTEILDDVALRICPIARKDALEMMREIRAAPLLLGARDRLPADIDALASILVAVGGPKGFFMTHCDRLAEVDLNPVIVSASGAVAVDARVVWRQGASAC